MKSRFPIRIFFGVALILFAVVGLQLFILPRIGGQVETYASVTPGLHIKAPSALTCSDIRARIQDFVKYHYSVRSFNEEISTRTFGKYFQLIDPGKNFFTAADIESFRSFEKTLPDHIKKVDCRFITSTHALLLTRVKEAASLVDEVLKKPFDFTLDESIETDRKKIEWAKDKDELKTRWHKQFKLAAMGMIEADDTAKTDAQGKKHIRGAPTDSKDIYQRLKKRFHMLEKSIEERTGDDINGIFMNAFALSLDPHSSYMLPQAQDDFKVMFSLQLVGIGASLTSQDGYTVVENVIPGGAAARDGRLKKGDKIISVDSGDGSGFTDVVDMDLERVVQLIRGKKDTTVKLIILRKQDSGEVTRFTLELVRDIVHLQDGEAHSDVMEIDGKKIGVINLPSFYIDYQGSRTLSDYRSSSRDMAREINALNDKKVDGIIVDLRGNGGGDLPECVQMTGLFIDRGTVVQVAGRAGDVESLDDRIPGALYKGPLEILISKQSASASEIFSGAIQDYGRGLIVGDSRTYGKGTVQQVIDIAGTGGRASNGAMKVTTSKFYRPSGRSNQEKGVLSDVVIPDILEVSDLSEAENDYVLPYSTISPARHFKPIQDLSPYLADLRKKSEERVKASSEFKDLLEKMAKAEKEKENTKLSLKMDKKKDAKPTATPTPKGTPSPEADNPNAVIRKDDIELTEAAHILVDSVRAINKTDWSHE